MAGTGPGDGVTEQDYRQDAGGDDGQRRQGTFGEEFVGGVFVVETLSVILQVASFRMLGRRMIACSPLHNHLLFGGASETKIVVRFWIGSVVLAVVAVASLKIR